MEKRTLAVKTAQQAFALMKSMLAANMVDNELVEKQVKTGAEVEVGDIFDEASKAITNAETALYHTPNRHLASPEVTAKEAALQKAIEKFQNRMMKRPQMIQNHGFVVLSTSFLGQNVARM